MKKLILAACVAALGVPVSAQQAPAPPAQPPIPNANSGFFDGGQAPAAPQAPANVQTRPPAPGVVPNIDYGYYGGPSAPQSMAPKTQHYGRSNGGYDGVYKLYGVPDELSMAEQERDRIRDAAVEFGRFRRQFTGSTQFWMDEHRTELAKSRYAMDEPMWRALHPPEYFGDGGYLYHTAESVGGAVVWGPPQPVMVNNPRPTASVSTLPVSTPPLESTVPASRNHTPVVPRVIAAEKPIYDASASMNVQTSK
jgi:hypothetical protein